MRKIAIILLVVNVCFGCRGPRGNTGPQGASGAGKLEMISGSITSNTMRVTDARIRSTAQVSVFIGSSGAWVELPYFLPLSGTNTFAIISNGYLDIYNAQLAGGSYYNIVILTPSPAPMPSGRLGDRLLW